MIDGASLLGLSSNNITNTVRYNNGTMYSIKSGSFSGVVYVPDEVDQNTSAFLYYPGSGGSGNDAKMIRSYIENGEPNQIIIYSNDAYSPRSDSGSFYLNMINSIGQSNGVEINNVDVMGFSASGPATYQTILNMAKTNPDVGGYSAIFNDVVGFSVSNEDIEALKNANVHLMFIEPSGTFNNETVKLAQGGVDVIVAHCPGSHGAHVTINKEILTNGIIPYLSGELDSLGGSDYYSFYKYDSSTGKWYQISIDDIAESFADIEVVDSPFRYYDKLKGLADIQSNNSFIQSSMNEIRGLIRNSDFLSNTSFEESYSSTTQIPNSESELGQAFFTECAYLLNCLQKDTVAIAKIGDTIKELNETSEKESKSLNDSVNYYSNNSVSTSYTPTSTNYSAPSFPTLNTTSLTTDIQSEDTDKTTEDESSRELLVETIKKEILTKEDMYSDEHKYVYEAKDGHKVIIHYDEKGVLGLEYYYFFDNENDAKESVISIKNKYANIEDVVIEKNTVKVIFNDTLYKDTSVEDVKKRYEDLKELVKEEEENDTTTKE